MNRLKELRKEKKLSQKEIAKEMSISEKTLSRWENGESQIKPEKAQKLADYFGVSIGYLLGYNDNLDMVLKGRGTDMADLPSVLVATEIDFLNDKKEIEKLKKEQGILSQMLRQKTTKKNLFALSDLEIGSVYLVSATKQNAIVLEQLKTQSVFKVLDDVEKEELEDSLIEAKQLVEMTSINLQILQQLSGTYNNVLNNNLNDTMKLLTVISILLTVPDIVTGFFGMNVQIPFTEYSHGWGIALGIILGIWILVSVILGRLMKK